MIIKQVFFLIGLVILPILSFSQIKFYEGDFKTPITDLTALNFSSEKGISVTIPIDAQFKKYDRVTVNLQYSLKDSVKGDRGTWGYGEWHACGEGLLNFYDPKSKVFADKYAGKKEIKLYLAENESFSDYNFIFYSSWIRERFDDYDFRITVNGHFEGEGYAEYNEYNERVEYKKTYEFSKSIWKSSQINFAVDASYIQEKEDKKLDGQREKYNEYLGSARWGMRDYETLDANNYQTSNLWKRIKGNLESASKYTHIDSVGYHLYQDFDGHQSRYNSLKFRFALVRPTETWRQYIFIRDFFLKQMDFAGLKEVEEKLSQILADKTFKTLKKKLVGMTDPETIIKTILEHS